MTRKKFVSTTIAALSLSLAAPLWAQEEAVAEADVQPTVEVAPQSGSPALWKVADEDTTIYLFGTIHALPPEVKWYDQTIAQALTSSDTLVTEIDERAKGGGSEPIGALPEGTTLRSILSPDQLAAYEGALGDLQLPPSAFDKLKPWLAGINLTLIPLIRQGYAPGSGVEKILAQKVPDMSREALETVEYQLGLFDSLPQDQQIDFMLDAIAGIDDVKDVLDGIVVEWLEGDTQTLSGLLNDGFEGTEFGETLLYNRNANWAQWIDERLEKPGTVFMAVGAGHLAGSRSVQELLKQRDISVERVQ